MQKLDYAIVFVQDMKKSIGFYRDVFGLALKFESPEWSEFVSGDCTVALHKASGPGGAIHEWPAGRCQLGFRVADLDAFHHAATGKGAQCLRPPKMEQFGKLAVYADPDGLQISVMQMNH